MNDRVLVIYGNIASGKSTISQALANAMPGYRHVNLDACRVDMYLKGLGNGPIHRDQLAQQQCLKQMYGDFIYETTAVTKFYQKAAKTLRERDYQFTMIRLECSEDTAFSRYHSRKQTGHIQAPFAYGKAKADIRQAIDYFAYEQSRVRADLRFNTEQLSPEQIVQQILRYLNRPTQ